MKVLFLILANLFVFSFADLANGHDLGRAQPLPMPVPKTKCRDLITELGLAYSTHTHFIERLDEREGKKILRAVFPSKKKSQRKMRVDAVNDGALHYFLAREKAGMPPMPPLWKNNIKGRSHIMWEIAIQAYIVSAAHREPKEISAVTQAMAYLLHDIDDIADRQIASYLVSLDWRTLNHISPVEFFKDSQNGFPTGYAELYENILTEVSEAIPTFNRAEFDSATMRMIRGGILFSPRIPLAIREQYLEINKLEHLEKLSKPFQKLYALSKIPESDIWLFLRDEVSNVFYGYTVKSLPDGICAFLGDFDPALMIFLGIFTAPGLLLENIKKEALDGEFAQEGRISFKEVVLTIEKASAIFSDNVKNGKFDGKKDQLEKMALILDAYGYAFKPILQKAKLWDEHYKVMHELKMRILKMQ